MCFLILFFNELDFLWKRAWFQPVLTGETPIIYYVLSHSNLRRARFSLKTRLRAQSTLTGETPIIYYVLSHRVSRRAHCHWGNLYYLMSASSLNRVIGETSIIYYVLPHPILRRARFSLKTRMSSTCSYWGNLYYLLCASPSCSSTSALHLGKSLLFSECFPSYRCSRLGIDPDRGRCQAISRNIGETSII